MSRIPFVIGRLPDPQLARELIEKRLTAHYSRLKENRASHSARDTTDADHGDEGDDDVAEDRTRRSIPWNDRQRILRRANRLHDCDLKRSVLAQLKPEDRKRLAPLKAGLNVVAISSADRADELAADMHGMYPWFAEATRVAWQDMRTSAERGDPGVRISPLLLDGPPGIGKSFFARDLARRIGVPNMIFAASHENASFGLVGSQKGWATATPGRLMNFILSEMVANPVVVLDEIEKAGEVTSTKGLTFSLTQALLPLLEPLSARRWTCPYFEISFDMGYISWILTTNNYRLLPEPLLSRCPPICIPAPTINQLKVFARRQGADRELSEISIEAICDALDRAGALGQLPDLRTVIRMLDRAAWLEKRPPLH